MGSQKKKIDWLNLFTQKRSQMDDQEVEGSHLNKKCHAAFLYLSQFSDSEPLTEGNFR